MMHHLFDLTSGLFTGRSIDANEETRAANCPQGFEWVAGVVDWQSQRVDLEVFADLLRLKSEQSKFESEDLLIQAAAELIDRLLLDYIPPQPDADHEWSPTRKRWVLRAEVAQQRARAATAMTEIESLETASLRPLREVRLAELEGRPAPDKAKARLQEIDARIAALRTELAPGPDVRGMIWRRD